MTFKKNSFFKKIFEKFKNTKKIPLIDLHVHTNWTDGTNTVEEMASAACKKKLALFYSVNIQEEPVGIGFLNLPMI